MESVPSSKGRLAMKQLDMPGVKHELRTQRLESQARELGLGRKPESSAQLGSNAGTKLC